MDRQTNSHGKLDFYTVSSILKQDLDRYIATKDQIIKGLYTEWLALSGLL